MISKGIIEAGGVIIDSILDLLQAEVANTTQVSAYQNGIIKIGNLKVCSGQNCASQVSLGQVGS